MTKLINAGLDNHTTTPTNLEISSIYCERTCLFRCCTIAATRYDLD